MLGLNPLTAKIAGGVAIVISLMGGVIWWQYQQIQDMNQKLGGFELQNQQLAADVVGLSNENRELIALREREAAIREAAHEESQRAIRALQEQADAWRASIGRDSDTAVFLRNDLPDGINRRLRQLYPGSGEDRNQVCDGPAGSGEGCESASLSRTDG